MQATEIESILRAALSLDEVYAQGDGSHFQVIVVAELFAGMSRVKNSRPSMHHWRSILPPMPFTH